MRKVEGVGGGVGFSCRRALEGVEGARAITSENHGPAGKSLHRKTMGIKFNGAIISDSELTNRYEVFDYVRNEKNIA